MMNKEAITRVPINEFARIRWSPRAFLDKSVEPEKLISLLEAGRWSASAGNSQPWRLMVGIHPDQTWKNIFDILDPGNQIWNDHTPVLMLSIGKRISSFDGKVSPVFQYDTGQAIAHLSIEAMHQGLHVHQMGGFSVPKAIERFEIPPDFLPITVIAVGYIGSPEMLPEKLKKRELEPRVRIAIEEFVFSEKFGQSLISFG